MDLFDKILPDKKGDIFDRIMPDFDEFVRKDEQAGVATLAPPEEIGPPLELARPEAQLGSRGPTDLAARWIKPGPEEGVPEGTRFRGGGATGGWEEPQENYLFRPPTASLRSEQEIVEFETNRAVELTNRFGDNIVNDLAAIGQTIISSPFSPIGVPNKEARKYRGQAQAELKQHGFKGSKAQAEQLIQQRSSELAAQQMVPQIAIDPADGFAEKVTDVGAGVASFIAQLAILRKVLPPGTPDAVVWETQNLISGGIPGKGAAMRLALGQIGKLPTSTPLGKGAKVGAESTLFATVTAGLGGDTEDIIVSALVPIAFNTYSFAKMRTQIRSFEKNSRIKAYSDYNKRVRAKIPEAHAAAKLRADLRNVNITVLKAKQRLYRDDAFAPARERMERMRQNALRKIESGKGETVKIRRKDGSSYKKTLTPAEVRAKYNDILNWIENLPSGAGIPEAESMGALHQDKPTTYRTETPTQRQALARGITLKQRREAQRYFDNLRRTVSGLYELPKEPGVPPGVTVTADTEPGGERFEALRADLEAAAGQPYSDDAVQEHIDAAGGWEVSEGETVPADEIVQPRPPKGPVVAPKPTSETEPAPKAEANLVDEHGIIRTPMRSTPETHDEFLADQALFRRQVLELPDGTVIVSDPDVSGQLLEHRLVSIPLEGRDETIRGFEQKTPDGWKPYWREMTQTERSGQRDSAIPDDWFNVNNTGFPREKIASGIIESPTVAPKPTSVPKPAPAEEGEKESPEAPPVAEPEAEERREGVDRNLEDYRRELEEDGDVVFVRRKPGAPTIRYKIIKTPDSGWVAEAHEGGIVSSRGGDPRGGGYSREEAVDQAVKMIESAMRADQPKAEPKVAPAEPSTPDIGAIDNINVAGLSNALDEKVVEWSLGGVAGRPASNTDVKKHVAELYGVDAADLTPEKGYSHKKVQEALEASIVRYARQIVETGTEKDRDTKQIFDQLVILYNNHPNLSSRTGKSIKAQAYSTPAPLAFLANELAGIEEDTTVYEPTAGTGMLLIGTDPGNAIANEMDEDRARLLQDQGVGVVTNKDAAAGESPIKVDAVLMNPPFGKRKGEKVDGYTLSQIDHIIAAKALKAMRDDGRAVMIIGAPKHVGEYRGSAWVFGNYVYQNYNVIADFEVSGSLYQRQGAAWPVRVIAVSGRKKTKKLGPRETKVRAKTWDEVYNQVEVALAGKEAAPMEIDLPEGWQVKSEEGRWQVLDDTGSVVGEIVQNEDGSFGLTGTEPAAGTEELGFPAEPQKFNNLADAMKALAAQKAKGAKTVRRKIDVVPTAPRKKRRRPTSTRRGATKRPKAPEDVGPVRGPAAEPSGETVPEGGRKEPGERPGERRPAGEQPGERPGPGGVPRGESEVPGEREGAERPPVSEREGKGEGEVAGEEKPADRPKVRKPERKPKAEGAKERKPVGVVGLSVGKIQVEYKPASRAPGQKQLIPTYLEPHVIEGLNRLTQEVGNVDDYVREQLGYESNKEMWKHLSAIQVDTLALAFDRIDKGQAFIIGHQTGVGKGRIGAAIVKREHLRNGKPVFWTAKKDLYNDFYRDLTDIGMTEDDLQPLMMNADFNIRDQQNNVVFEAHGDRAAATQAIRTAINTGNYNLVLTTYSQINMEGRPQREQLPALSHGEVTIMDESHNAAGQSNTGEFIRDSIIPHADGVVFMSATYAKTPQTMVLYGRTGLLDAFDGDVDAMINSIHQGGEPFQEVIASTLARANSYIRTELDFSGVDYQTFVDASNQERDTERADTVTELLRDIVAFDRAFSDTEIETLKEQFRRQRRRGIGSTVQHTNFAATVHNALNQLLLSLKVDETVAQAKQAVKDGKRVFIALQNTMEGFLDDFARNHHLQKGDTVEDYDYREVLRRHLRKTLQYKIQHPNGDLEVIRVPVEDLPERLQEQYHFIEELIESLDIDLHGSPIDAIKNALEKEGIKVGEMTGRSSIIELNDEGKEILGSRTAADKDKSSTAYQFNNEDMQVIVANVAAAEGISLHSSEKFENKEQRVMIIPQAHNDINKFVQMLGRIHRTGQVNFPAYRILMTSLPAEIRPAAVLERKMRSLNANTSAKTKGAYQQEAIPDILNLYGDYLTAKFIIENPDIARHVPVSVDTDKYQYALARPGYHGPWHEDKIAQKFTGKLALLGVEQQQQFYDWMEPEYEALIEYLNATDQNELISIEKDFQATEVSSRTIFAGDANNAFQEPATLDRMSIKREFKAMTRDEIRDYIAAAQKKAGVDTSDPQGTYGMIMAEKLDDAWEKYEKAQGDKLREASRQAYHTSTEALKRLQPGHVRRDGEGNPIILLEVVDTFGKEKYSSNPAAPSQIKLKVTTPGARSLRLTLSQWAAMDRHYGGLESTFAAFERGTDEREERWIVNGNLIAGMGIIAGGDSDHPVRPTILNYTMEDGTMRQGMLLPRTFSLGALPKRVIMVPEAAAQYIMEGPNGKDYRSLTVGDAIIYRTSRNQARMEVPKSKARGLKFYGDAGLTALTGEFETHRKAMAAIFSSEQLPHVLVYLKDKGNAIKSDENDPDTAREYNNAHRDTPEEGFAEELGMAAPAPRVIRTQIEKPADFKKQDIVSRRQIVQHLSKALGVPIRGIATNRKKNPGWYNTKTRGIRMKKVNDLRVASHEVGHHIDWYFNDRWATKQSHQWYGMGAELVRMGKALYGKKRPPGGYKSEGYAEFISGWLTGAIDLKKEAPRTLKFFEEDYLPNNPMMADILHTAKDMIDKWKEQGAEARFDSQIGGKLKPSESLNRRASLWWQTSFADVSAPLQRALQENIPDRSEFFRVNDPGFIYTDFAQTEGARARTMVMDHTIDLYGNVTGISLKEALKPVANESKDFIRYMIAARSLTLESRGIHSGFDPEDAAYIYKTYDSKRYQKAAIEVTEWNHRLLDYLVKAGALEAEKAQLMRDANPIYIPFIRLFAPNEIRSKAPSGVGRGLIRRGKGVYKIYGSDRPVDDPLETMVLQARRMISIAHKSHLARALVSVERKYKGLAGMIEKVPAPIKATTFSASQIKGQLAALGIDVTTGDLDDAMMTVFSNSPVYLGKEHIISVVIGGKRSWYELSPELYRILEDMDQFQLPKLLNLCFGKACRATRLGATGVNASFGLIRNPIRDALDTVPKARYARGPLNLGRGIVKDLSTTGMARSLGFDENEAARRFIDMGGKLSGYIGQDRTSIQHLKGELLANTVGDYAIHTVQHPVHAIREVFGVPETGLRVEEFEKARKDWMDRHMKGAPAGAAPPDEANAYAFAMASDQTINYRRAGQYGRWLNQMIPFWNANAQDISKVYRTFTERPKQSILWGVSVLTLGSLGLWWLNKDEEWYKDLPSWEKANNIHIPVFKWMKGLPGVKRYVGDEKVDHILRLPVPFLMGHIFMSLPTTIVDSLYQQDPKRMTEFMGEFLDANIKPLFEWPALLGPMIDLGQNKDWAGRPIVSESLGARLKQDQYKQWTTKFAKALSKGLRVPGQPESVISPIEIEYLLNSYSGGLYRRIHRAGEIVTGQAEKGTPSDLVLLGTLFVRDPYAPKSDLNRFYDRREVLNKRYASKAPGSRKLLEKRERVAHNSVASELSEIRKKLVVAKSESRRKALYGQMKRALKRTERYGKSR